MADRATGIYARGEQIVHIDHRGAFDIAGPLTVPTTPQVAPVLAWYAQTPGEITAARDVADVLIVPAGQDGRCPAAGGAARLYLEVPAPAMAAGHADLGAQAAATLACDSVAGVILRPAADEPALPRFLDDIASARTAGGIFPAGWSGTLRERLSLPVPPPLSGARPAFPAPDPAAAGTRAGRGGR